MTQWRRFLPMFFGVSAASISGSDLHAQAPSALSGYSSQNSNKPIDIESDRLEVDDKKQVAVFAGNVSATQGDYNLRSQQLEVTYDRGASQDGAKPAAKPVKTPVSNTTGDNPLSSGQVKNIKAHGSVVVTSVKDDQKATGDDGFFDVKEQKITMTGHVLLSQKGSIVGGGEKLNIDLATGVAKVVPPEGKRLQTVLQKAGGAGDVSPMESLTGKKKSKDSAKAPASAAAGWQTQGR